MEPALSGVIWVVGETEEVEVSNSEQITKVRPRLPAAKASTDIACAEKRPPYEQDCLKARNEHDHG
jgi:hypothetical protein